MWLRMKSSMVFFFSFFLEDLLEELPNHWWSSDYDSSLRVQGACV